MITLTAVVTTAVILAILYIGRVVLIPIAMAIFFTYVLSPVVVFLQRRGLARIFAVILTMAAAIVLLVGSLFFVAQEMASLTGTITDNAESIKAKISTTRSQILGSTNSSFTRLLDDIENMINPTQGEASQTVVLEPKKSAWTPSLNSILLPFTEALGQIAFSFILVIFMLLSQKDLGDRLLRLLGENQLTVTTRAMNDASERLSKYLFRQFIVNFSFGLIIAIGLFAIGLSYSLLWGFIIAVMRYVPYIGTWLGLIPPAIFAFAIGKDWSLPISTVALIFSFELVVNNFLEPRIYGHSLGVSEVAQLISAAIWSFLWGPVGLILSSPITTCLLVLGRHTRSFWFLEILLGNKPALSPSQSLFQRLAAKDQDGALRALQVCLKTNKPEVVFDETLLPALTQLKSSRMIGQIDADDDARITVIAREVLVDILEDVHEEAVGNEAFVERIRLLASPAQDEFDRLSLDAFTSRLSLSNWDIRTSSVTTLTSELLADAVSFKPQVILIGSLPPGGVAHARYLVKRFRQQYSGAHILIARWHDPELKPEEWKEVGCDTAVSSIQELLNHLAAWKPILQNNDSDNITLTKETLALQQTR